MPTSFFFKVVCMYLFERESMRERGKGQKREREKESEAVSPLSTEPDAGPDLIITRSGVPGWLSR